MPEVATYIRDREMIDTDRDGGPWASVCGPRRAPGLPLPIVAWEAGTCIPLGRLARSRFGPISGGFLAYSIDLPPEGSAEPLTPGR